MKNRGFKWMLTSLADSNACINVAEIYMIRSFLVTDYFYTENHVVKHKEMHNSLSSKEVFEIILTKSNPAARNSNFPIAIGYLREGRVYFCNSAIKEFLSNPHHNFTCIQKCSPPCKDSLDLFVAALDLKGYSYTLSIFKKINQTNFIVKNIIWTQKIKDICQSICIIIQASTPDTLLKVKIEFLKDDLDEFWVSNCSTLEFVKDYEVSKDSKAFKDLRQREQNTAKVLKLKIDTPDITLDESVQSEKPSASMVWTRKADLRAEYMTQDFVELLCRNRVKERKKNDLQLPSLIFYTETEEIKKEHELIVNMIEDQNPTFRFPRVDKHPRKSAWVKPLEPRRPGLSRLSSPNIISHKSFKSNSPRLYLQEIKDYED
jgi:hypothetical protein